MKTVRRFRPFSWLFSRRVARKKAGSNTGSTAGPAAGPACPNTLFKPALAAGADDRWGFDPMLVPPTKALGPIATTPSRASGFAADRELRNRGLAESLLPRDTDDLLLASDDAASFGCGDAGVVAVLGPSPEETVVMEAAATMHAGIGRPELNHDVIVDVVYGFVDMARGGHGAAGDFGQRPTLTAPQVVRQAISTTRFGSRLNPLMFHSSADGAEVFLVDGGSPPASPSPPAYQDGSYFVFEPTRPDADIADATEGSITFWGWPPSESLDDGPDGKPEPELPEVNADGMRVEFEYWC